MMQRKHQRQAAQRLLPARQITDILPTLLRRHDREQNPLGEGIERIDELELGVAAHGDHLVHFLQPQRDEAEAGHEALEAELAQVVVPLLGEIAGGDGSVEVGGAGGVFVGAAAVFREDGEVDVEVLGLLFQDGDFAFEGGFVHVGEFVFGVSREVFCGLVFAEVADGLDVEFA